jgi:hypothetical protein
MPGLDRGRLEDTARRGRSSCARVRRLLRNGARHRQRCAGDGECVRSTARARVTHPRQKATLAPVHGRDDGEDPAAEERLPDKGIRPDPEPGLADLLREPQPVAAGLRGEAVLPNRPADRLELPNRDANESSLPDRKCRHDGTPSGCAMELRARAAGRGARRRVGRRGHEAARRALGGGLRGWARRSRCRRGSRAGCGRR